MMTREGALKNDIEEGWRIYECVNEWGKWHFDKNAD